MGYNMPGVPAEAVIASPALFSGRGNPAFMPSGSPRSQKTLARDDDGRLLARTIDNMLFSFSIKNDLCVIYEKRAIF